MQIYIFKNNEQFGPFDAAQIEDYIKTNVIAMEDLAWAEGEPEWIPLSDLLLKKSQIQDHKGVGTVPSPMEIEAEQEAEAKVLTAEIAERFLKDNESVNLSHFTSIKDDAAHILANHNEELELNGLVILSANAAKALTQHKGDILSFDALASLSDAVAEALAQHRGFLWLNGLTSLSNTAAKALAQHKGWLSFNGLTSLSDAAAQALAQHSNDSEETSLSLNGLTSLSDAAAQALAQHGGPLELNGLRSLSDFTAQALAQHQAGWLSLSGLTILSDRAAAALAQHKGRGLVLSGLTSLSDTAARALTEYQKYKSIAVTKYVRSLLEKNKADFEAKAWAANIRSSIDKNQAEIKKNIARDNEAEIRRIRGEKAQAKARIKYKSQKNRLEYIRNTFLFLFFIFTPIIGVILLFIGFRDVESDSALNLILTGFFCIGLPFFGILLIGALHGDSNPQQRNAQIAMIQRQQMINKLDDIKNENNDY